MSSPWRPEREISEAEASDAVQALGLAGEDVRHVAAGWDNTVLSVDHDWLFRFPRRRIALPGVERELEHLPGLAEHLPLPIPVPEHHGTFGDPAWPFWGARALPGTELATSPHADVAQVAGAVGRFLRTLHDLPVASSLPVDPMGRADAHTRAGRARDLLRSLGESGVVGPLPEVEAFLDDAAGAPPSSDELVTSHGDLYARHVLVDAAGHASGVIDWGDLCAAPRSVDLAFVWSALDPEHRPTFWAEYGTVDADTVLRARTMAICSLAMVASYAHDSRLHALLEVSVRHLHLVAD